jgi:hypothetical protein
MGTGEALYPVIKWLGREADHLHLVPRSIIVELYLLSPIRLHEEILGIFAFSAVSRLALFHIQWVVSQGVKRPGREADISPPWSYTSIPSYVFMAWPLIEDRGNFTLRLQVKIIYVCGHSHICSPFRLAKIKFKFSACSCTTPRRRMAEWMYSSTHS